MLQSDYKDRSALTSYEKGLFVLQWDDTERSAALKRYINDGVESGFLHMQEESEKECVFRLHCSLAANYKFSYRGAYSRTRIFVHELEELLRLDDSLIESAANKIVARVCTSEDPNQVVLFDEFKT